MLPSTVPNSTFSRGFFLHQLNAFHSSLLGWPLPRSPSYNLYRCSIARNTPQGRETFCWLYPLYTTEPPQGESWQCPGSVQTSLSHPLGTSERPGSTRDIWLDNGRVEDAQNPTGGTSGGLVVKNPPANAEDTDSISGPRRVHVLQSN